MRIQVLTLHQQEQRRGVPADVQSAVDDLFDNYTNDNITVTDASFSRPTLKATSGTYSFDDFSKIPLMKNFILKEGSSNESSNLKDVQFRYYGQYQQPEVLDWTFWTELYAIYNGNVIKSKKINIKNFSGATDESSFTKPVDLTGVVTATHSEELTYVAPLMDTANSNSSRGLSPNTDWYTDKFMISKESNNLFYRVSTSEWINEGLIKPHANTDFHIQDPIKVADDVKIHTVSWRAVSGEPVYKSNGELWDYTLPNNSTWQVTSVAFDQYGSSYYEVSTGAWVRNDR